MSLESKPEITVERYAWRGIGIAIALEAVRLLAAMPHLSQVSEGQALEYMGVGLLIPAWAMWGEKRGWLKEDVGKAISSTKSLLGFKK